MTGRLIAAAAGLALGLGFTSGASAMNLQPGMLTMMQQGGTEHGVQVGCALPGYDVSHTCAHVDGAWLSARGYRGEERRSYRHRH